ncbi:MAG: PAS domain S-box protein [Caenispirillum sp.]|nr:PAS domain S-box protein [Caenispirillum sp.]
MQYLPMIAAILGRRAVTMPVVVAALLLAAAMVSPVAAQAPAPAGDIPYCVDPDWAPYEHIDPGGRHDGIAADLLALAAQRAGLTLRLVPTPDWTATLEAAKAGRCVMLSFLNETPARAEWLSFTQPLFVDPNVLVTREDHPYVADLAAEGAKTMVLPEGTSVEERLRRDFPELRIVTTTSEADAFAMVSEGRADMTLRSLSVAVYVIRKEGYFNLKVAGQVPGYENRLRAAFRKDHAHLVPLLDAGIATLTAAERREIANRHVSITIAAPLNYRLIAAVAAVPLLVLAVSLFWLARVRGLNRRLQASEQRYRMAQDATGLGIWDWDCVDGRIVWDAATWRLLGHEPQGGTIAYADWRAVVHPDDLPQVEAAVQAHLARGEDFALEMRYRRADGSWIWVHSKGRVVERAADGTPRRMMGTNTDVTARKQAELTLRESERLYRVLFESVSDALFLVQVEADGGFRYLRNNPAHRAATGLTEVEGRMPADMLPQDVAAQAMERYAACLAAGGPIHYEEDLVLPAGPQVWATSLTPVFDDGGRPEMIVGVARNVTEARRAAEAVREARERLATYFSLAPVGIFVADAGGAIVEINDTACRQMDLPEALVRTLAFADLVPEDDRPATAATLAEVRAVGSATRDMRLRRQAGGWFWASVVIGGLPGGHVIGFIEDTTERRRMETELRESNAELEQFAYAVSHDLRQPLRMISGFAQLLERSLGAPADERQREFLAFVRNGARRMDQMLLALLEYSRVGRLGEPMQTLSLGEVAAEALHYLGPALAEAQAVVDQPERWPVVTVSRNEAVRLFQNLLGNALKYRRPDTAPHITLTADPAPGGHVIAVADNGIGIDPAFLGRLFKVFQRLQTQDAYEGTGIGLALCRRIVERHGGRIWIESAGEGCGVTVRFFLPDQTGGGDGGGIVAAEERGALVGQLG